MWKVKLLKILNVYFVLVDVFIYIAAFLMFYGYLTSFSLVRRVEDFYSSLVSAEMLKIILVSHLVFTVEAIFWGKLFSDNYKAIVRKIARLGTVSIFVYIWFTALYHA